MKPSLSLSAADLAWLGRALEDDFSGLIGYENLTVTQPDGEDEAVRRAILTTAPVWEAERKLLILPLIWDGRVTALAKFSGLLNLDRLRTTYSPYLTRLAHLTLRNFQLTRSVVVDPVTNLFRRVKLLEELGRQMALTSARLEDGASRMKAQEGEDSLRPTVALVVVRVLEAERMAREHGRQFLIQVQRAMAHSLAEELDTANCPARLDEAVFGWLEPGLSAEQARLRAEKWAARVRSVEHEGLGPVPVRLIGGVAAFPEDLPGGLSAGAEGLIEDLALEVEDLAGRALAQSQRRCGGILSLADVRRRCGAVTEILPLGRVVIDLGRAVGLEAGMRFYVAHHSESVSDVYKAELALLNINAESSTAEIVALEDEKFPVAVGDKVKLVEEKGALRVRAADEKVLELGGEEIKVLVDQSTGLPNPRALPLMVEALAGQGGLALLIIRLDGLVSRRSLVGQQEADRLLVRAAEIAQESRPDCPAARAGVESIALLIPGVDGPAGLEAGWKVREKIEAELEQPVSIGVAAHPFDQAPASELVDRAFKALDHASFPQAEEVVLFNSVSLNVSGDRLYQRGDVEGAVAEYERALALDKDNVNVLNSLGVCYGQLGRLPQAADCFERAAGLAAEDFMTWYNLGFAQRELGRLEEAEKALTKANELNGEDFSVLYSLGRVAMDRARFTQAADWFGRAAQAEGAKPGVHRWLGEALARIDKPDEALACFKTAVKVDPRDAAALSWLGRLYQERRRDRDVALSLLRQAVELEPENQLFRERLAQALLDNGQTGRAVEEFSLALELGGRSAALVRGLALSLAGQGQLAEAVEALQEALDLAPDDESIKEDLERLTAGLTEEGNGPAGAEGEGD